jgi:hypothetical protein
LELVGAFGNDYEMICGEEKIMAKLLLRQPFRNEAVDDEYCEDEDEELRLGS